MLTADFRLNSTRDGEEVNLMEQTFQNEYEVSRQLFNKNN